MSLKTKLQNVKIGQLINVDEVDLIIELSELAPKTLPSFLVKDTRSFRDGGTTITLITLDHVGSDVEYLLMAHSWNDAIDVKLFRALDCVKPDKRSVLQASDDTAWLFDGDDYPGEIYNENVSPYVRKVQSEIFGSTAIVEYETPSQIVNYRLLLIEEGIHNVGGGLVRFYEGRIVSEHNITL